jgi:hypothetical protein
MSKLVWAIPCFRPIVDVGSNLVTYVDVLDSLTCPAFPGQGPFLVMATLWQCEGESELDIRVVLYSPEGNQILKVDADNAEIPAQIRRARVHVGMPPFPIQIPGRYEFGIQVREKGKWKEVTRVPLDVEAPPPVT